MPKASTRALGKSPTDRARKDHNRIEPGEVSHIRHQVVRDARAARDGGGAQTITARVDALTSPVPPREIDQGADRRAAADARDRAITLAMLDESRRRIASALGMACDDHHAAPGVHCWGDALSGTRGLCMDRYVRGLRGLAAQPRPQVEDGPGLAPYANAIRNASRDARLRSIPRHPDRGPIVPARSVVAR